MRIQHNIMAMNAYRNYNTNTKALSGNLEKLSSGYKINRAGDDAAGLAISEKMRAQITGLDAAQKNVKDGISLVKTAEGAMQEIQDMLNRMDYLATQSANGTYQDEVDRENLQKEVTALKDEINRIADSANFNGIKLLDGSLDANASTGSVKLLGSFVGTKSAATKGVYESGAVFAAATANLTPGDTFQYSLGLSDGTSTTVTLTMKAADNGENKIMVAEDGTEYSVTKDKPTLAELNNAVMAELKKTSLGKQFDIAKGTADGQIKLTSLEAGLDTPAVLSMDAKYTISGATTPNPSTPIGVKATNPLAEGLEIDPTKITCYNGANYDDAVFTINGKKFVLLTEEHDASALATTSMNATEGLGSDVTILVGGQDGLTSSDDNFAQNIAKIAAATGLTVTDAVDESAYGGTKSGVDGGAGIRLSPGKGGGGLTLQIGDTADSYNQMKVIVGDMHTKALGIDNIDIGNQSGAANAIQTIKNAINRVSSVRGDLGAVQNRLEHTGNNLSVMAENIQDAESTIRDTDVANEMMSYVKNNILVQSAQAMLAQANQVPQGVLQLLG